jgi:hypothetical protein
MRIVCCLSSKYSGRFLEYSYAIDPRTASPLDLKFRLDLMPDEISDLYDYKYVPDGAQVEALEPILTVAMQRLEKLEFDRAYQRAADKVLLKYQGISISRFGLCVEIMLEMKPFWKNAGTWKEGESVFEFAWRMSFGG